MTVIAQGPPSEAELVFVLFKTPALAYKQVTSPNDKSLLVKNVVLKKSDAKQQIYISL